MNSDALNINQTWNMTSPVKHDEVHGYAATVAARNGRAVNVARE